MNPDPKQLEAFFLEAAAQTFAGGAQTTTITELPGSKVYRYQQGDLLYVDTYWTNGPFSGGKSIIYASNVPVWMMDYDGWCKDDDKEVTSFLKRALMHAYTSNQFIGGRGPREYSDISPGERDLVYRNHPHKDHSGFTYFEGRERIFEWPTDNITQLFWHRYKGLLLFGDVVPNIGTTET